jgi:hypothetical protein
MAGLTFLGQMILSVEEVAARVAPLVAEREEGGALGGIEAAQGLREPGILWRVGELGGPAANSANLVGRSPAEERGDLLGSAAG